MQILMNAKNTTQKKTQHYTTLLDFRKQKILSVRFLFYCCFEEDYHGNNKNFSNLNSCAQLLYFAVSAF